MSICQIYKLDVKVLWLGRFDEHGVRPIGIDVAPWLSAWGAEGTFMIMHWRPGEDNPYNPEHVELDGTTLVWTPDEVDLAISGRGTVELHYYIGDDLAKSRSFQSIIERTRSEGAAPTSATDNWVARMEQAAVTAQDAAEDAEDAAATATEGAQAVAQALPTVTQAAQTATSAATTATNAATEAALSEGVASAAANAAQSASETATAASQTAVGSASTATTKAAEAAQSATTATQKASEAAQSATASSASAGDAEQAATTATAKAQEASTSASEAAASASQASSSATSAASSATTASNAQTVASQAASTATSAASTATAAKTGAETAQTAAESAAASVSASAAQIATNTSDISAIKADLTQINAQITDDTFSDTLTAHENNKYIASNGNTVEINGYAYSELVPVKKGDLVTAQIYCPSSMWAIWYATEGYASKEHAVNGTSYSVETYTLISDRDGYVCCNYYASATHTLTVTHHIVPELEETVDDIETKIAVLNPLDYNNTIPTHEAGKYFTIGGINSWDFYSYSDAIPVTKGDTVIITAYFGPGIYAYYCDEDFGNRRNAIGGDTYAVKTYTFVSDRTGYIVINFGTAYEHKLKIIGNALGRLERFNPLYGKTVVWCGDSICRGNTFNDKLSGWAGRVASLSSCEYVNYGVGGSTICNNVTGGSTPTIYTQIETAHTDHSDADYVIFDGGCNDADLIGNIIGGTAPEQFGSFTENDFGGEYDTDTFCGAFETICMHLSQYWLGKHVGYIVPHKMGVASYYDKTHNNYRAYYETAMQICAKWGIPVLNLWDGCYLNPKHTWMCDTSNTMTSDEIYEAGFLYADRQHLTSEGYDYESLIVNEWIKSL